NSENCHGPVPAPPRANSSSPSSVTTAGSTTAQTYAASNEGKKLYASFSEIATVKSSTFWKPISVELPATYSSYPSTRAMKSAIGEGLAGSSARNQLEMKASALTGLPEANFRSCLILKVYVSPSSLTS